MIFLALAWTAGCGTVSNCFSIDDKDRFSPYGGVTLDAKQLKISADRLAENKPFVFDRLQVVTSACDIPLCAVADTLLLPVTVTYSLGRPITIADRAPETINPTFKPEKAKGP